MDLNSRNSVALNRQRVFGHNTVINWVKLAEQALPELENYEIP